jgi:hemolysin activation/secretion protein
MMPFSHFRLCFAGGIFPLLLLTANQAVATTPVPTDTTSLLVAQTPLPPPEQLPRDPQPPLPEPQVPEPLPPPSELLPPAPTPTPPNDTPPASEDVPATIVVERFQVNGSTVFSPAELAEVTAPFTNRPITLAELFQARTAVTNLYIERGYVTSGAYIPPQTLEGGVVQIQVVEGQVEAIRVTGTRRLRPAYVQSRIAQATKTPLNRDRLLEALQLLQLDPLIASLSAELSAGTRPGVSLLDVRVTEANPLSAQVLLDNARSPSVGTDRRQVQLNHGNFLGYGDALSLAYTNTDGSNSFDLSYIVPVSPSQATVSLNFSTADSRVIESPFEVLNIESDSRTVELAFRQPLLRSPNQEFAIGLSATRRSSTVTLDPFDTGRIPFPSPGAQNGKTRVSALRFFQDWVKRNTREVLALRSQFSLGVDLFDATINEEAPDSRFFAWRTQAQWVRLLAPDTLLLLRGDLQLADRPLLPLEQFGVGGNQSVRGYRQDALLTDNGLFLSAEVRVPIVRFANSDARLLLTPFFDFGTGWNRSPSLDPDPDSLASVGVGLLFQLSNRFSARLDWGIPLTQRDDDNQDTLQESGLHFFIQYNPF